MRGAAVPYCLKQGTVLIHHNVVRVSVGAERGVCLRTHVGALAKTLPGQQSVER